MKRRFFTTIILALTAILCAFVFAACGGDKGGDNHPADTFYIGSLSAQAYASTDDAAKAFIDVEINGDVTDATFVSYTKTADLTDEEVEALDIPDEERADIASVEKGEVKYTVAVGESDLTVRTSADEEKTYVVIIVTYNDATVKYYAPMLDTGDPLTKSYYDSVFSYDNFKNITLSYRLNIPVDISMSSIKMTAGVSMKIDAKWDEDTYGYVKSEAVLTAPGSIGNNKVVMEQVYVNDKTSRFCGCSFSRSTAFGETTDWVLNGTPKAPDWVYGSDDDNNEDDSDWSDDEYDWDFGGEVDDDVLSLFTPAFDYSYFVKTKTGFKINSEKLTEYLNIALEDAFEQMGESFNDIKLGKTTASADYYVSDGKITESVVKLNCKYSVDINGVTVNYSMKESIVVKYTGYGTTIVVLPTDIDFDSYL